MNRTLREEWGIVLLGIVALLLSAMVRDAFGQGGREPGFRGGPRPPGLSRPRPPHLRGRPLRVRPPRTSQPDEVMAARLVAEASQSLSCERAGEMLRVLSNRILSSATRAYEKERPRGPGRWEPREKMRWREHFRSPLFWREVWDRVVETYQSCEAGCFEDGVAVGMMSAVGYCSASIELGGLSAPGFLAQARLPLCENSIFIGCQQGYRQGVELTEGCSAYTQGLFERVFLESQSQDCHLEGGGSLTQ
jgi:hypothetical protein